MIDLNETLNARGAAMWASTLIGLYGCLSSTEDLVHTEEIFGDRSLLNWKIAQLNWQWLHRGWSGRAINAVLAYPNVRRLLWARLLVSAALGLSALLRFLSSFLIWSLFFCEIALFVRNRVGQDGSRQMAVIVLLYLTVVSTFPDLWLLQIAAPAYVAAQLLIAYWFSGFAKLLSPIWRSGAAFRRIMSTRDYGNPVAYAATTKLPAVSFLACWCIILGEVGYVSVVLFPPDWAPYVFATGILLHGTIAIVMGLNLFFFSFLAAYPPLFLTLQNIQHLMG